MRIPTRPTSCSRSRAAPAIAASRARRRRGASWASCSCAIPRRATTSTSRSAAAAAAPRVARRAGDRTWAEALSRGALDAPFYDPGPLETVDADALLAVDPSIVARLHDASRPAAFRVLISTDPITTTKIGGAGTHVGTTVYVN